MADLMKEKTTFIYLIIVCIYWGTIELPQVNAQSGLTGGNIVMASIRSKSSIDGKALILIFTEAFKRVDKVLVYKFYPSKRASLVADSGVVDGEICRVFSYNEKHPGLIRVEEPILSIRISAFATDKDIKLKGWESLRNTDYKIEYMRGGKLIEEKLAKFVDNEKLSTVTHWSQGIKKLDIGRTNIFISLERTIQNALKTKEFINSGIHKVGVMEEQTIHAFLNVKHKALATKLSKVLKEMKKEGLIKKYLKNSMINDVITH